MLFHDLDHKITDRVFSLLKKKYSVISLSDFIAALEQQSAHRIPPNALILTFDDGHIGNFDLTPIAQKFNLPISIFVCSSLINTHRHFWFSRSSVEDQVEDLKRLTNGDRCDRLRKLGFEQENEYEFPQALQLEQIGAMKSCISFQSHTRFHPILPSCTDEEAHDEIWGGKLELEEKLGNKVDYFAYPNGDYSLRDEKIVRLAGFRAALTVDFGFNDLQSNRWRLKRIPIHDSLDVNEIVVKATGLWSFLKTRNGVKQKCGLMPVFKKSSLPTDSIFALKVTTPG